MIRGEGEEVPHPQMRRVELLTQGLPIFITRVEVVIMVTLASKWRLVVVKIIIITMVVVTMVTLVVPIVVDILLVIILEVITLHLFRRIQWRIGMSLDVEVIQGPGMLFDQINGAIDRGIIPAGTS